MGGSLRVDHVRNRIVAAVPWIALGLGFCIGSIGLFFILRAPRSLPITMVSAPPESSSISPPASIASGTVAFQESQERLDGAFSSQPTWNVEKGTRVLLVPHHLVAARYIAGLFSAAAMRQKPSTIYLLVPDHFQRGRRAITMLGSDVGANGRNLTRDVRASDTLYSDLGDTLASVDDAVLQEELAMQALVPYVARAFPSTKIVALTVRICEASRAQSCEDARAPLVSALTSALKRDPKALLISSVDFSHYLPAFAADFHDELAQDVIEHLADREVDRVELDSADILAVTLSVARELGLGNVVTHAHTNSLRILQSKIAQDSTSHFIASFSPGEISSQEKTTMLFVGDMMFDREVRNRMARSGEPLYPFDGILGQEERLMRGQDAVIGNLEGPISPEHLPPVKENDFAFDPSVAALLRRVGFTAVSQANNHTLDQGRDAASSSRAILASQGIVAIGDQVRDTADDALRIFDVRGKRIGILSFNVTDNPLDRDQAKQAVAQARQGSDSVVVFIHWGNEYQEKPSSVQTELGHWFIDQGVDAIIGTHPHWMQSVETYRGRPIAYSLGNFIFDQDWSKETQYGLAVGLVLEPSGATMHFFPIHIVKSHPVLLTGDERQVRLDHLAEISDPSLAESIRSGVMHTKKE
ncbi:MAG: AmmeMemoRadiSam system protein B [Candidatus Uhrbacteria bacterium]|nr:AmmeMemoRadiSam system protein B [Candidatus Uhrbacteria bacterium]